MIRFKKTSFFIFLTLLFGVLGCSKSRYFDSSAKYKTAIEESRQLIDSILKNQKIPGIDIAISIHGETVWSEGFGFADLEHKSHVIAGKTRFRIGSVSKSITSSALGRLIDKGKINLDTSIHFYIPYFPKKRFPISVRQIGSHLGGIRHYRNKEFLSSRHYNSVKSGLEIFQHDPLIYKPGMRYSYSSYGYNLLSAVIEGASGVEFLSFMRNEIFTPLNMEYISADKNDSIILYRSSFYDVDSTGNFINAPYVDNSYKWAGGGFIASTTDLIRFGEAHMKPGFLSEETLAELTTSQVLSNGDSTGYGIGWKILKLDSMKGYGHGGGSVGGITQFKIFPQDELVLVILSNSTKTNFGNIPDRIIRNFLRAK